MGAHGPYPRRWSHAREVPGDEEPPELEHPSAGERPRAPQSPGNQGRQPGDADAEQGQDGARAHPAMLPPPGEGDGTGPDTLTVRDPCGQIGPSDHPLAARFSEEAAPWKP